MVNSVPSTPKKPKRCSSRLSPVILSPYFSPTKGSKSTPEVFEESGRTNHEPHILTKEDLATHYDDNGDDTFTSPGIRLFQNTCTNVPRPTLSEQLLLRLEQLKPNLIQGSLSCP